MSQFSLLALLTWFSNHPHATFQEFSQAFDRAQRIGGLGMAI